MGFPVIPTTAVVAEVTYVEPSYVVIYDAIAEVHVVQVGYLAKFWTRPQFYKNLLELLFLNLI